MGFAIIWIWSQTDVDCGSACSGLVVKITVSRLGYWLSGSWAAGKQTLLVPNTVAFSTSICRHFAVSQINIFHNCPTLIRPIGISQSSLCYPWLCFQRFDSLFQLRLSLNIKSWMVALVVKVEFLAFQKRRLELLIHSGGTFRQTCTKSVGCSNSTG